MERRGRSPGDARERERQERNERSEHEEDASRLVHESPQELGASADSAAEEIGCPGPQHAACWNCVAPAAPAVRPLERLGPLPLQVRASRTVVERPLELAPPTLEPDPGKRGTCFGPVRRNGPHDRSNVRRGPSGVVATNSLRGRAAEIERLTEEVRVRTGRDMHDRMGAVDELELAVIPARPLRTLVLAVADLDRTLVEGGRGSRCVEEELDHLPVAFVEVVPVVEGVEQPVLQRQLPRTPRLGDDVRVDGRLRPGGDRACPLLVRAAGSERVPREVEVVSVEPFPDLSCRRRDRDQVGAVPRAAQRDRVGAEEDVDVEREIRLAWTALLRLGDDPDDRRESLG